MNAMPAAAAMTAFLTAMAPLPAQSQTMLDRTSRIEASIAPGEVDLYSLPLQRGQSAEIIVLQQGVDVAVDLLAPGGRLIATVDSPNGRQGPEPVTVQAAATGRYSIRVRTLSPREPRGKYRLDVTELRDAAATRRWLAERRQVRRRAVEWLRARSIAVPASLGEAPLPPFDSLAGRVRVMGLGEATHGSRELADLRLAVTRRLVERHGYRLVALEQSAARLRALAPYATGEAPLSPAVSRLLEHGWIGRRALADLVEWTRRWNLAHPTDRVRLIGTDAQDFSSELDALGAFLVGAYGEGMADSWAEARRELLAADEQAAIFGNSDISGATRAFAVAAYALLEQDRPLLGKRFPPAQVAQALDTAQDIAQFADYNGNGAGALGRSRDWYMAANIVRALDAAEPGARLVYWAHNAHVATTSARYQPTGAVLRNALGCSYAAVGTTFGKGAFIAQIANDPENRLAETRLPAADEESIDGVMAEIRPQATFSAWPCGTGTAAVPAWLAQKRPMHWVGGLFEPGAAPSTATRPFVLTSDFDGVFHLPEVTAEAIPDNLPRIGPRPRV